MILDVYKFIQKSLCRIVFGDGIGILRMNWMRPHGFVVGDVIGFGFVLCFRVGK